MGLGQAYNEVGGVFCCSPFLLLRGMLFRGSKETQTTPVGHLKNVNGHRPEVPRQNGLTIALVRERALS